MNLSTVASTWPTQRACSGKRSSGANRTEMLRLWPTAKACDGIKPSAGKRKTSDLTESARAWATPSVADATGGRMRRGAKLWMVAVSTFKTETYRYLRLDRPTDEDLAAGACWPAGTVHLPSWADSGWCKQLVAEQLVTVKGKRGFSRLDWQKMRERNEALDCRVYARAAAWILGADRWAEGKWRDLERQVGVAEKLSAISFQPSAKEDELSPSSAGVVRRPMRKGRRVFQSTYMS